VAEGKTVIKKVRKGGHEGHHGGSWKVAYADFVTAMMAFFLLLWLLAMVSPEKRANVSAYFNEYSVFSKAGTAVETDRGAGEQYQPFQVMQKQGSSSGGPPAPADPSKAGGAILETPKEVSAARIQSKLTEIVQARLGDIKDQVIIEAFEGGVRVQLMDKQGQPLYGLGGMDLTEAGKRALGAIAEALKSMDNRIAVEGHTDARGFSTQKFTNWELSTSRASVARQELERLGVSPDRLIRVAGYAAVDPLVKDDPYDPRNRRISILIFDKKSTAAGQAGGPSVDNLQKAVEREENHLLGQPRPKTGQGSTK
jgi:chemotaxis protein MotB